MRRLDGIRSRAYCVLAIRATNCTKLLWSSISTPARQIYAHLVILTFYTASRTTYMLFICGKSPTGEYDCTILAKIWTLKSGLVKKWNVISRETLVVLRYLEKGEQPRDLWLVSSPLFSISLRTVGESFQTTLWQGQNVARLSLQFGGTIPTEYLTKVLALNAVQKQ